jgi:hypothetical protein
MSELPQADALPRVDEGFDAARVEEAFATFADRVRELESVAAELRAELRSLRAERVAPARFEDEDWPVEAGLAGAGLPPSAWVAAVQPPLARGLTLPRLAIEGAFLVLVALLAGLADLDAAWIVVTRGADGMSVVGPDDHHTALPPTNRTEVWDVTGAGDTVIAVLTLGLAAGIDVLEAAHLANVAAGVVVRRLGVSTVSARELTAALKPGKDPGQDV